MIACGTNVACILNNCIYSLENQPIPVLHQARTFIENTPDTIKKT